MLDINLFRVEKGANLQLLKDSQIARGHSPDLVDSVVQKDLNWRTARFNADAKNKQINLLQKDLTVSIKSKSDNTQQLIAKKKELEEEKKVLLEVAMGQEKELNKILMGMGNIVHSSVRVSMDEKDNEIIKKYWPQERTEEKESVKNSLLLSHHEVLTKIKGYDQNRGTNVAGHRGYFLMDHGVEFNLALVQYGLDFLGKKDYTKLQTPFFMKKEIMAKTAQLEEFDEALYKLDEGESDENSKYLIATSEQPISAFHMNEWFVDPQNELPKKYAGYSTCFRKEAGSHGKETWGIFRIHQFEKIEQFVLTDTDKSWEMHEEMMRVSEEFYESLELPYRVISIVSGALNNAAAKKYDLEAWFPFQREYKELVSCSNCTDYQSRRLEIRGPDATKQYAHCLNGTLCATERTLCCILENYQTPEGVRIPKVLQRYMNDQTFIPFKSDVKDGKKGVEKVDKVANDVKEMKL